MKKTLTLICILFVISFSNAQTEKETIDFLNSMFSTHMNTFGGMNGLTIKSEIDSNSKNKEFIIEILVDNRLFEISRFSPKNINSIITNPEPSNEYRYIEIISSKNSIFQSYPNLKETNYTNRLRLNFTTDSDELNRIKKALMHLMKLNGASFPNQNLFKN